MTRPVIKELERVCGLLGGEGMEALYRGGEVRVRVPGLQPFRQIDPGNRLPDWAGEYFIRARLRDNGFHLFCGEADLGPCPELDSLHSLPGRR